MVSLALGLLFVYLTEPTPKIIFVYPTPDNVSVFEYKDVMGNCFKYNAKSVECPKKNSLIETIPIQE
jgi:hypothetical protein